MIAFQKDASQVLMRELSTGKILAIFQHSMNVVRHPQEDKVFIVTHGCGPNSDGYHINVDSIDGSACAPVIGGEGDVLIQNLAFTFFRQ